MVNNQNQTFRENFSKTRITGISLPEKTIHFIDKQRGDISRSKYILRIIEKTQSSEAVSAQKTKC
ncbi:MAG: hypothetical protein R2685_13710 [Candidatus Nitrosocosmicus sp.]|nr:hypothetical protein [Candidatus Nitrosocosmicus sp.]